MIDKAISFLVDELNDYIVRKTGVEGPHVDLAHMADTDSDKSMIKEGRMGCALINVEEERVAKAQRPISTSQGGQMGFQNPEIKLNLFVLFAANPREGNTSNFYKQALQLLSHTVCFFQGKYEFTPDNSPNMDPELQLLRLDLVTIPLEEQSYLWGAISAAYMPSVVYRVRLISIREEEILETAPVISELDLDFPANQ